MALTDAQRIHFQCVVSGLYAAGGGSKAKPTKNILYYTRTAFGGAEFSGTAFLTAWLANCKAAWLAFANESWTMVDARVRCVDDEIEGETISLVGEVGGVAGDCLPNNIAAVISKRTALRGKSYRGRIYIPGVSEDDNVNNALTAGAKTRLDTLANKLDDQIIDANAITFIPVVFGQPKAFVTVPPTRIKIYTPITSCVARKQIGSANSRKAPVTS